MHVLPALARYTATHAKTRHAPRCARRTHLLRAALWRNEVDLVQHDNELFGRDFTNDEALCSLCLDALRDVNDKDHEVNDLRAANDGFDQTRVARAIHERHLQRAPAVRGQVCRYICGEGAETQVQRDATLHRLRVLVQGSSGQVC